MKPLYTLDLDAPQLRNLIGFLTEEYLNNFTLEQFFKKGIELLVDDLKGDFIDAVKDGRILNNTPALEDNYDTRLAER
jgi:hypothetical protein